MERHRERRHETARRTTWRPPRRRARSSTARRSTLRAGELTVLVGPNGAGKTTLMRALAGLCRRKAASTIDGTPLCGADGARARAPHRLSAAGPRVPLADAGRRRWSRSAAMPHADPFSRVTDADRARGGARARGHRDREPSRRAPVTTLSGGERARVALARALATRGADPARRRADRVARSAPSARGDGAAARAARTRRRGARDRCTISRWPRASPTASWSWIAAASSPTARRARC